MKSHYLHSGLFSVIMVVTVGIIFSCFAYVYALLHHTVSDSITIPHIFYSVKTVTAIDAQGNSFGNESVYRLDGLQGQPVKIADLPAGVSGAQWAPSSISYDVYSKNLTTPTKFHVTLDNAGNTVWNTNEAFKSGWGNTKDQVLFRNQWIHPDGTYATISEIYCTDTSTDGPCSQSFRLIVTDLKTGQQKTYTAKTFDVEDGQLVVRVLDKATATSAYVQISGLQDPGNAFLGLFDFATGKVVRTLYRGTVEPYSFKPYQFLRMSDDGKLMYVAEWIFVGNEEKQIAAIDVQTGELKPILKNPAITDYVWPKDSTFIYFKPSATTLVQHDAVTGKETTISWTATLNEYVYPYRFTTTSVNSSTGVYGGKLILIDTKTKKQRVVYDQLHEENAYGENTNSGTGSKNAVVGDNVYRFLGLEQ